MEGTLKAVTALRGRLTSWAVSRYRAASRPMLPPDPEHEELAEEAVALATALTTTTDTDTSTLTEQHHRARIKKHIRKKRREGGWGTDDPEEAPLHDAWEGAMKRLAPSEHLDYPAWRLKLAHLPARRVTDEQRDLIRLARRVETSLGRYLTRAERRRRQQVGEDESGGGIRR